VTTRIFLAGLSGSGKSSVAERLAGWLGIRWRDVDVEAAHQAGSTIAELWREDGEAAFRAAERAAVERLVERPGPTILALGGGTLEDPASFARLTAWGTGVWLEASPEILAERVRPTAGSRPLIADGDPTTVLERLARAREPRFAALPHRVATGDRSAEAAAVEVLRALGAREPREVVPGVYVGRGVLAHAGELLARTTDVAGGPRAQPTPILVATDGRVWSLHGRALADGLAAAAAPVLLAEGEAAKNVEELGRLWGALAGSGADRDTPLLALGGGAVSDVAGLAAATYKRGVPLALFPTTLLAQADAAIGGKNAIDVAGIKNLVGTFHPPALVAADTLCLLTLSERDYASGWAEVVKSGIVGDPDLLELCEREAEAIRARRLDLIEEGIARAARVKARIVDEDPREAGGRRVLNLGHTLGHALEAATEGELTHGEAVAIGIVAAARLAESEGVARPGLAERIAAILTGIGLPTCAPSRWAAGAVRARVRQDKKRKAGAVHAVLPVAPGEVVVRRLEDGALDRWIAALEGAAR
jgi:shikimate kinase/3-dehydroquinate synthase